ncbi:MAG: mandelate racemase/muconate lactonizing enzyme family protein [Bryobacteraceae bacterium]
MAKRWTGSVVFAPPQSESDQLAITTLKAWRLKEPASGRRYTVVKLESRGGAVGYSECGPSVGSEIAQAKAAIVGKRATDAEFIRHHLASSPGMESAVNNAMLDVAARSANVPIYQFLGGPTRFKARVVAHLEGEDEEALVSSLRRGMQRGFRAFSFPIPPRDAMWRMQVYVDVINKRVDTLKKAGGGNTDFVLDGKAMLTPGDASFIATALEREHLLWFDEPTEVLTNDALSRISDESVMPLGLGRNVHKVATFQNLLRWGCVDILRPSMALNSIRQIRRMAAVAETHYVAVGPYHTGGPIATVAAIHLAASLPNFFAQQVPLPAAEQDRAMRDELTSGNVESAVDGFAQLINKPGLGIEVNEQALGKYSEEVL